MKPRTAIHVKPYVAERWTSPRSRNMVSMSIIASSRSSCACHGSGACVGDRLCVTSLENDSPHWPQYRPIRSPFHDNAKVLEQNGQRGRKIHAVPSINRSELIITNRATSWLSEISIQIHAGIITSRVQLTTRKIRDRWVLRCT